jgi:hypothetical protein
MFTRARIQSWNKGLLHKKFNTSFSLKGNLTLPSERTISQFTLASLASNDKEDKIYRRKVRTGIRHANAMLILPAYLVVAKS